MSLAKQWCGCRNVRTSQGTFIARHEDKQGVLAWIEDRLAQLTGLPANHGEVRLTLLLPAKESKSTKQKQNLER